MMLLSNSGGRAASPLDFNLLQADNEDDDDSKSMLSFLGASRVSPPPASQFQPVTPPPTVEDVVDEAECAYCSKVGPRADFRGRFCSKICVGRFALR